MSAAPFVWIIGHGLLGRSVATAQTLNDPASRQYTSNASIAWLRADECATALDWQLAAFLDMAEAAVGPWRILWCAGAGVVATAPESLRQESATVSGFLLRLTSLLERRPGLAARGTFFHASSGGGVYAASPAQPPYTESSPVGSMSAYGAEKLAQERAAFAMARATGVALLVGRISNLYGPGQDLAKPQGLIGHVGKCALLRRPAAIYVPLDTIRDYLYASDAGMMIVEACSRLESSRCESSTSPAVVKIFASEVDTTVAAVLASWRRSLRRPLGVVLGSQPAGKLQPRTLSFRSEIWPELRGTPKPLLEGVGHLLADQLRQLRAGTLSGSPL